MKGVVRVRQSSGALLQLSVGEAVTEASQNLQKGDDAGALRLLEQAVRYAPGIPVVRYLLGVAQVRQNRWESAISNLEKAVRGDKDNVDYLISLAEAVTARQPADAIPHFARAVELGSRRPDVFSRLAALLIDARRPEDALRICDQGLAVCGEQPEILGNRGVALKEIARYEESLDCLLKTEARLPHDYRVLVSLGNVLI